MTGPAEHEPHPCGHEARTPGCGGCDTGAIEFVILDEDPTTLVPYDPARDTRRARDHAARPLTVGDVRRALEDLPDYLHVELLLDHALAGHGGEACDHYDVEYLAPVVEVRRGEAGVEVLVAWEAAG